MGEYAALLAGLGARPVGAGWDAPCPVPGRHRNGDRSPSLRLWVGTRGELVARCLGCGAGWGEVVRASGTDVRQWWPAAKSRAYEHERRRPVGKVVATYPYFDAAGALVAEKLRREPGDNGAAKSFSWRRPVPAEVLARAGLRPDAGAWAWGLKPGWYAPHHGDRRDWRLVSQCSPTAPGIGLPAQAAYLPACDPGLYRLPQLQAAAFEDAVFVVEGEKKADLLAALRLAAASGPDGAGCWRPEWAAEFAGRRVVVWPDTDRRGLAHAAAVAGSLLVAGAAAVRVVLPGPGWEVAAGEGPDDWLGRVPPGERRRAVAALVRRFPAFVARGGGVLEPAGAA